MSEAFPELRAVSTSPETIQMCGIWGYVAREEAIDPSDAWDGLCSLTDRGPDDWGMYFGGTGKVTSEEELPGSEQSVVLGNRRLSILDISDAGNQPMRTADGRWIVYNGEVYNYREIRETLRDRGYSFESETDTEVVLKAYSEYGAGCVQHFRGMFAFAVYDERDGTLFAARDRFGIKPFYYAERGAALAFASEVTSMVSGGVVEPALDPVGVDGFLSFGYVPSPRTILTGVRSLPPGTVLTYDPDGGGTEIDRYYEIDFDGDTDDSVERFRELLCESVRLRLRSDVPVGTFLSGGLDSSTVAALVCGESPDSADVRTYSIGFEQTSYSEAEFAREVASELGTDHTTASITGTDVRSEVDDIFEAMDQPTIDGVNTYFVSKLAADDGVKVALSGLGSDELLYGYSTFDDVHRYYRLCERLDSIPDVVGNAVARVVEFAGRYLPGQPTGKVAQSLVSDSPFGAAYLLSRGLFTQSTRRKLLTDAASVTDWSSELERADPSGDSTWSVEESVSYAELTWYLHSQLLRDTDSMSMTHSLEVRVPFLDTGVAEFCLSLDDETKSSGQKAFLKRAIEDDVPSSVIERKKSGFVLPFDNWLREDLREEVRDTLEDDVLLRLAGLNPEAVRSVQAAFEDGNVHWTRLWSLYVLACWVDRYVRHE